MTDLEMTRLCAEAMGLTVKYRKTIHNKVSGGGYVLDSLEFYANHRFWLTYDPLQDDAQAMALVKKFDLQIGSYPLRPDKWCVWPPVGRTGRAFSEDLNRAIVECMAKMQSAKAVQS